ncbi:MAG: bifunctional diaminohydroxyphosphoribosylaminopyrimidine deaminase/5-amino-6-(5-phosphoribosylamino)uracil reductase RibD [Coprococcus sp.]
MAENNFNPGYMKRAIELAQKGCGAVNPNPLVGAVIVKDGRIIGEGYHRKYGELHAERDAFAHLTEAAEAAEMYVTLEPCCHYGKQPPCVDAIIEHGIKKVYCGSDDPNDKVAGKGFNRLREAGIEVVTHCMKEECDSLNDVFFHYIVNKTPYVVMKYAMTMDGKIAAYTGKSKWITGEKSRRYVMELRNRMTGIMAGIGTVIADDPMLTCRIEGGRNPVRIICDSSLRIPINSQIVKTAKEVRTIVASVAYEHNAGSCNDYEEYMNRKQMLADAGIEVIETDGESGHVNLKQLMSILGEMEIDGILLEGGSQLNYSAIEAGIVNEVDVFVAPKILGGDGKYTPVGGRGVEAPADAHMFYLTDIKRIENDVMLRYKKQE